MKYLVIATWCAECRNDLKEPLITIHGPYSTLDEAKGSKDSGQPQGPRTTWIEHQQGGWFSANGQGDEWILPVPDDVDLSFVKPYVIKTVAIENS